MELFREKGFEATTMRDIAAKAGVALGGAYYYFSSKDAIVLAFYREMQESSNGPVLEALAGRKKLKERIRCVLEKRLEFLAPKTTQILRGPLPSRARWGRPPLSLQRGDTPYPRRRDRAHAYRVGRQ